jgi:hypothetical protein
MQPETSHGLNRTRPIREDFMKIATETYRNEETCAPPIDEHHDRERCLPLFSPGPNMFQTRARRYGRYGLMAVFLALLMESMVNIVRLHEREA